MRNFEGYRYCSISPDDLTQHQTWGDNLLCAPCVFRHYVD